MSLTKKPVTITASTTLTDENHMGTTVLLNAAAGLTVTLPPATGSGHVYDLFILTSVTSNDYIVKVTGNDIMMGYAIVATDGSGETFTTAADSDTITMNGSTKGGLASGNLSFKDIAADKWQVSGYLPSSSTEATPFSATVT